VRDDGSSDNTNAILKEYHQKNSQKIIIFPNNINQNIGVIKSFEFLLQQSNNEYIMFCDQDDIWLPNKIEISFNTIKELEAKYSQSTPIAIHSNLTLIDENENLLHNSFWQFANIRPNILNTNIKFLAISNSATGCTMMINQALKNIVLPFPEKVYMHDMLIALTACKHGILHPIYQPLILYRQHNNNTIGAIKYEYSLFNKVKNIKKVINKAHEMYHYSGNIYKNIFDFWFTKLIYYIKIRK
jgi:glycosyltransferase involved in cell wall biosynthesis